VDPPALGDEWIGGFCHDAMARGYPGLGLHDDGASGLNRTACRGAEGKDGGGNRGSNQK
jgi:hypothetical protein